jgi:hypothetical protein
MIKTMHAKYPGKCSKTGRDIRPGDMIFYDTYARSAFLPDSADDPDYLAYRTKTSKKYISHVFNIGGKEYYRNKSGLCIDAPCCGCCTI